MPLCHPSPSLFLALMARPGSHSLSLSLSRVRSINVTQPSRLAGPSCLDAICVGCLVCSRLLCHLPSAIHLHASDLKLLPALVCDTAHQYFSSYLNITAFFTVTWSRPSASHKRLYSTLLFSRILVRLMHRGDSVRLAVRLAADWITPRTLSPIICLAGKRASTPPCPSASTPFRNELRSFDSPKSRQELRKERSLFTRQETTHMFQLVGHIASMSCLRTR
ncbi:hypothetical protein BJ170DRAFT_445282 [Xylariales sp. AK1849]|nr:hypothetical protein BJ170DRAFT_445282 [Xylariales sp. AK1849]